MDVTKNHSNRDDVVRKSFEITVKVSEIDINK
jgi:hypothetical protein